MMNLTWFKGKRIFVTGHTGFKGAWLCRILVDAGAEVTGYALEAPTEPNLFAISGVEGKMHSVIGDIRDCTLLEGCLNEAKPEIVIHLAAQPLVRESYANPLLTYETNVMGTVNLCECIRKGGSVKSFLNVTTDKVYDNKEQKAGYVETDPLDGYDPYSNSKSCSELVTHSYKRSFFDEMGIATSTARAGNVIGGGDFSKDRIIPDCYRAVSAGQSVIIRNPDSVRPYQHVLEPLTAYLMIVKAQYEDASLAGYYNVGPEESGCVTTLELVKLFCETWGPSADYEVHSDGGPHEAGLLKLDTGYIKARLGWHPAWDIREAVEKTAEWYKAFCEDPAEVAGVMQAQVREYLDVGGVC